MNCDAKGRCNCKCDVIGDKCSLCEPGHQDFPNCLETKALQLAACNCSIIGTASCSVTTGKCTCKQNYVGKHCHDCKHGYTKDYSGACIVGTKVLIATGDPSSNGQRTEIIDVEDPNFKCKTIPNYPRQFYAATGGLIKDKIPFICGGYDRTYGRVSNNCFKYENGAWRKEHTAYLRNSRRYAGYGSAVWNNQLVLVGGTDYYGNRLNSIELLAPKTSAKKLHVYLPTPTAYHCLVSWNSSTVMMVGGTSNRYGTTPQTYFIDLKNNRIEPQRSTDKGLKLKQANYNLACAELEVMGRSYVVVTGGNSNTRITEVLDKANTEKGWQKRKFIQNISLFI